jgi:hypothetical protein
MFKMTKAAKGRVRVDEQAIRKFCPCLERG